MSRKQVLLIKKSAENASKLTFSNAKCKTNYVINSAFESTGAKFRLNKDYEDMVKQEIGLMQDLEDDLLLWDYSLGNKLLHGEETAFDKFIEVFNKEMNKNIAAHKRRHNAKMHSVKYQSISYMIKCLTDLLPPGTPMPCSQ